MKHEKHDQQEHGRDSLGHDLGALALRLTSGGLLTGHGAQKLFGSFGGYGLEGTGGWLESMGLRPGKVWAVAAGGSEFSGGLLSALGLLHPLGPVSSIAAMSMAWAKAHRGKPIWVTSGGAELPLTNIAIAAAMLVGGPGRLSLDRLLGIHVPKSMTLLAIAAAAAGVTYGALSQPESLPESDIVADTGAESELADEGAAPRRETAASLR